MKSAYGLAAVILLFPLSLALAQESPQPGPEHKMIAELNAGTWIAVAKMPDGTESKGESTSKMECGGMWLVTNFEGEFGGAKFQGKGLDSYDSDKKKFVGVWVDSMSNSPMILEGTYDEKTKTMTMEGVAKGPDGKPAKHRLVTVYKDKDHHTFQMFMPDAEGKEASVFTIEYTRKK